MQKKLSKLMLDIPVDLKHRLAVDAAKRGVTMRSIILEALLKLEYDIPLHEIRDKRKTKAHLQPSKECRFVDPKFSDDYTTL